MAPQSCTHTLMLYFTIAIDDLGTKGLTKEGYFTMVTALSREYRVEVQVSNNLGHDKSIDC